MAKLNSYYTLCPLIDQQNLLGVEKDSNSGCAIVTLGRNIVIRYKLQNLKQVSSWSSKERFTTQVVYDETTKRYAAVFNGKNVRVWLEEESDLDNVKKHKFLTTIQTILTHEGVPPIVVLQNGACASLEWALQNRKTWTGDDILKPEEKFVNCQLVSINEKTYMCAMTKLDRAYYYIVLPLQNGNYVEEAKSMTRIELKRTNEELVGHALIQDKSNAYLLTLWSHGRLYSYSLIAPSTEPVPGVLVNVVTAVNTKHPVVMVALNEMTIAIYGADSLEEGAVLIIYNVRFKLVQATQKLKLFTKDAKLWKVEDNLLLAANRHLAVAPFRLAPQKMEAMLGSSLRSRNNSLEEDTDIEVIQEITTANWRADIKMPTTLSTKGLSNKISKQVIEYQNEGMSNAAIQQVLIPQLIESKDISAIIWCFDNLNNLSEKLLVDILSFCLSTPDRTFRSVQNGSVSPKRQKCNISRNEFLNRILNVSYSDRSLHAYLKTGLNFNDILRLLNYLIDKLQEENSSWEDDAANEPSDEHLYKWANLLIDSHYQNYILSRDSQVVKLFNQLKEIIENHVQVIKSMENLRPMIARLIMGKPLKPPRRNFNKLFHVCLLCTQLHE